MPSISTVLANAPIACALAANDIENGSLYGQRIDTLLPQKIYTTYKVLAKIYSLDNNYPGVQVLANYLWEDMGKYGIMAEAYSGSGGSVSPVTPSGATYLIPITGADFTDATNYDNPKIVGKALAIFWNDINRYLFSNEYTQTATGINITIAGFDATANPTYELFIYIINP